MSLDPFLLTVLAHGDVLMEGQCNRSKLASYEAYLYDAKMFPFALSEKEGKSFLTGRIAQQSVPVVQHVENHPKDDSESQMVHWERCWTRIPSCDTW